MSDAAETYGRLARWAKAAPGRKYVRDWATEASAAAYRHRCRLLVRGKVRAVGIANFPDHAIAKALKRFEEDHPE